MKTRRRREERSVIYMLKVNTLFYSSLLQFFFFCFYLVLFLFHLLVFLRIWSGHSAEDSVPLPVRFVDGTETEKKKKKDIHLNNLFSIVYRFFFYDVSLFVFVNLNWSKMRLKI